MRVLITEGEGWAATHAEEALRHAGHEVVRCIDPNAPSFPCRGLDGVCALDEGQVDVVLTIRGRIRNEPSPREEGVACALRRRIPLVVAGATDMQPFGDWTSAVVSSSDTDAIVHACEAVAGQPLTGHEACVQAVAEQVLQSSGVTAAPRVTVTRHGTRLHVSVQLHGGQQVPYGTMLPARVVAALREYDPHAHTIDVAVEGA